MKLDKLNTLEKSIHEILTREIKNNNKLKIVDAALLCDVSPSKISKFITKLGFANYKQYRLYITGDQINYKSSELVRIKSYINTFNYKKVEKLATIINQSERILLHGIGPSLICVDYFAYRLQLNTKHNIQTSSDYFYLENNLYRNSLLIIYTTTGTFSSFENLITLCKKKHAKYIIICEEHNEIAYVENKNIIYLTNDNQENKQLAFEKTRTLWFIYIEEVISYLKTL